MNLYDLLGISLSSAVSSQIHAVTSGDGVVRFGGTRVGFQIDTDIFWPLAQKPETAVQGYINTSLTAIIMFAAIVIMFDSIRRWVGTRRRPEPVGDLVEAETAVF